MATVVENHTTPLRGRGAGLYVQYIDERELVEIHTTTSANQCIAFINSFGDNISDWLYDFSATSAHISFIFINDIL